MSTSMFSSRFFRRAPKLPHEDYEPWVKCTIIKAVRQAWEIYKRDLVEHDLALDQQGEDAVTAQLLEILNAMRERPEPSVPEFSSRWFDVVYRDAKVRNYSGENIDKMPDLVFRVHDAIPGLAFSEYRALFAECKVIAESTHGVGLYLSKGLVRFVNGDYSWTMPSGMMVAYLRDPHAHSIETTLIPQLTGANGNWGTLQDNASPIEGAYVSTHARTWLYPDKSMPGVIQIMHIWLR